MEKLSTSPWARQAKEHWKEHRPKMYAALEKSGQLNHRLNRAVEQTGDDYVDMLHNGMPPDGESQVGNATAKCACGLSH